MKSRLLNNLGLKILSVVLALLIWLMIMNSQDPTITRTLDDIPVTVVNDDVVTSRGYGYTIESGEAIDVKVKGRRSVVDDLSGADFIATADFKTINSMNMVSITLKCQSEYEDELVCEARTDTMAVKLEDQDTKAIGLRVVVNGAVKEGYYLFGTNAETGIIQVTGAVSQVERVKEVIAEVDIEGLMESTTFTPELYALDLDGEKIDPKKISLSNDKINVDVNICQIKSVDVRINVKGTPAEGYYMVSEDHAPASLSIAAEDSLLSRISALTFDVDITGLSENKEFMYDLSDMLEDKYGERCVLVDSAVSMSVLVTMAELSQKRVEVSETDVKLLGRDDEKYTYRVSRAYDSAVTIKGQEKLLTTIAPVDLDLYVDVATLTAGQHFCQIKSNYTGELFLETGRIIVEVLEKNEYTGVNNEL